MNSDYGGTQWPPMTLVCASPFVGLALIAAAIQSGARGRAGLGIVGFGLFLAVELLAVGAMAVSMIARRRRRPHVRLASVPESDGVVVPLDFRPRHADERSAS